MDYILINHENFQTLGAPPPNPHLYSMTRKCAKPCFHWTFLVVGKNEAYILYFAILSKKYARATDFGPSSLPIV